MELAISVYVHLDDSVGNSLLDLRLGGTGTSVENQEQGLLVAVVQLLGGVLLVLSEDLGSELDVTGLVDSVHVSESGGDGKVGRDLGERLVDVKDVFGLGVQAGVVDLGVVDTVLLSTGDTDLHLEPLVHLGHPLKVLDAGLNVLLLGLFGQVQHVRGEEGDTVLLEVGLVGVEHSIEPGQELLGAVVRVHDDGDSVSRGDGSDESGGGDGTGDRGLLLVGVVLDSLSGPEGGSSLRDLEDDGRVDISGGLQGGVGGRGRGDVLRSASDGWGRVRRGSKGRRVASGALTMAWTGRINGRVTIAQLSVEKEFLTRSFDLQG